MIQIYKPSNTAYEANGDMTLQPIEATVQVKLNGAWQADLSHPIDKEGRWRYIEDQAVIKMPSFNRDQLFRIVKKNKTDSGVSVTAEPIFMDAKGDCYLKDIRPTNVNGQQALNQMLAPNKKYSGKSDITMKTTAYYQDKNFIQALNGDDDNSFINRWGGEILYNNFQVVVNKRAGGDYGVQVLYGKNIEKDGIKEEVDFSAVVTRIYPKAFNGYSLSENGYVDSPVINSYPTVKSSTMTFEDVKMREDAKEDDEANGIIVCDTQSELDAALRKKCQEQYDNGIDKPAVTISVNMVALQNTDEYKDYKILEDVSLGDTVHCKSANLGIVTDARIIELKYDSINKKVDSVKIGDVEADYFNGISDSAVRVDSAIRPDGTVIGQQVEGLIDMALAQLKLQSTEAKRLNVRAIMLEDTDPESPLYGAMCWGTQGFQIASERTEDGKDWKWSTFGTAKGFFANLIVAGTMLYDRCRGGTAEIGGINNASGKLRILDETGKEIGRWDKDGAKVYSGEINGPVIIAGGISDIAGLIKILDEKGNQIGTWGKDGIYVYSGGELRSKDYVDGLSGFKFDLTNGLIEAAQLLIKTAAQGRMERGFLYEDGSFKILGTDGETIAHIACTWSYPDGPDGIPSGWTGRVAFGAGEARDNYYDSFWVNKNGQCGIHSSKNVEIAAINGLDIDADVSISGTKTDISSEGINLKTNGINVNDKETKSGRIEFSDGTYIDIQNGYIIGGNSKAGAF